MSSGPPIEWTDDLRTGIDLLDEQHKTFFLRALRLHVSCKLGRGGKEVDEAIKFLRDYAVFHFAAEEAEMEAVGYRELESHRAEHQKFLGELWALERKYDGTDAPLEAAQELARMSTEWFAEHIRRRDMAFAAIVPT